MLIHSKTGGATPLVIAARNGHYDVVNYLLNKTPVDCEQSGSGMFFGQNLRFFIEFFSFQFFSYPRSHI